MPALRKSYAFLITAIALLIVTAAVAEQATNNYAAQVPKEPSIQSSINAIVLDDKPESFNRYNTNGTPSYMNGNSALFYGSNKTNMYSDMVSFSSIKADKSLVLEANITVNINSFSNSAEDQFAFFATDDTTKYKSDEFGFLVPETGSTWYAYVQSPQIAGFFVWKPLLTTQTNQMEQHSFKAVYSNDGLSRFVDFYIDGKLFWNKVYPDISGKDFHMVLTSHKVSAENIDISQNQMEIGNAVFSDMSEGGQSLASRNFVLSADTPILPIFGRGSGRFPKF